MRKQCVPGPLLSFVGPGNEASILGPPNVLEQVVNSQVHARPVAHPGHRDVYTTCTGVIRDVPNMLERVCQLTGTYYLLGHP